MTRGVKNNNWGNIVISSNKWQGKIYPQSQDSRFEVFENPAYGLRALIIILNNYYNKYKYQTVSSIINHYAPPFENNTEKYISAVCLKLGVGKNEIIALNDATLKALCEAIVKVENGFLPVSFSAVFDQAINLIKKKID